MHNRVPRPHEPPMNSTLAKTVTGSGGHAESRTPPHMPTPAQTHFAKAEIIRAGEGMPPLFTFDF